MQFDFVIGTSSVKKAPKRKAKEPSEPKESKDTSRKAAPKKRGASGKAAAAREAAPSIPRTRARGSSRPVQRRHWVIVDNHFTLL